MNRLLWVGPLCIISLCSGALVSRHFSGVLSAPVIEKREITIAHVQQLGTLTVLQVSTELLVPITENKNIPILNLKAGEETVVVGVRTETVFTVDLGKSEMTRTANGIKVSIPQPKAKSLLDASKTKTLFEGAKGLFPADSSRRLYDLAIVEAKKRISQEIDNNPERIESARQAAKLILAQFLSGLGEDVQVEFCAGQCSSEAK